MHRTACLIWCCLGLITLVLCPGRAAAQASAAPLRLFLDTSLVSYTIDQLHDTRSTLGVGPGVDAFAGGSGIGVGVAVSRWLVPGLYLGFDYLRLRATDGNSARYADSDTRTHAYQIELRPSLEVRWARPHWCVPQATLGLSLLMRDRPQGDSYDGQFTPEASRVLGLGPTLQLGVHLFPLPRFSVDLGLGLRQLFFHVLEGGNPVDRGEQRETALLLTLGASFWLLGKEAAP